MHAPLATGSSLNPVEFMSKPAQPCRSARPITPPPLNRQRRNLFLARSHAASLTVREDTCLHLTEGCLWITFEAPHNGLAPRNGDHFIGAGDRFDLLAGEAAVLGPVGGAPGAWFDLMPVVTMPWIAVMQQSQANLRRLAARHARRWKFAWRLPV